MLEDYKGINEETQVFLNGGLIGMAEDCDELLKEIKNLRSVNMLPYDVSISYDDIDDELHVFSDNGRLLRPSFCCRR